LSVRSTIACVEVRRAMIAEELVPCSRDSSPNYPVGEAKERGNQPATARRKELRRGLQFQLLRYLIRIGEAASRARPELAMQFELPALYTPLKPFLTSVKAMLTLAETEREFLLSVGLSELALTDLKREVAEFEEAIDASQAGRRGHVGASADLDEVSGEVTGLVGILDGLNRHRFRNDSELEAAWDVFPLDPSFEPDAQPRDADHEEIFGHLQRFRAARLVEPIGEEHMYYAAMNSRSCQLTPLGQFYWHLANSGQL
jgi:hypothetical protein